MKKFLAIYTGSPNGSATKEWESLDRDAQDDRVTKGMKAWGDWVAKFQSSIVEVGGPLGKTKQINRSGVSDISNAMAAYVIVKANSHEEAAKMFLNHPHFMIFPGDAVEVMECMPIPMG